MSEQSVQFSCSRCGTLYSIESGRIGEEGRIAVCASCDHRFLVRLSSEITAPAPAAEAETLAPQEQPEPVEVGDELFIEGQAGEAVATTADETVARATLEEGMPEPEEAGVRTQRRVPPDVEMPDLSTGSPDSALATRRRWRDPMQAERKKKMPFFDTGADREPTKGILYKVIVVLVGLGALASAFLDLGPWRIDPIWSASLIGLGLLSFRLQNVSGLLVSGLFGFFYPLAAFSGQVHAIARGEFTGVIIIGAQTAFAVTILILYGILMARQKALFALKEGSGQSIAAFLLGLIVILLVVWVRLESTLLPTLGELIPDYSFYIGVSLPLLLQACALSLAVAIGYSARAVRNQMLTLANIGLTLGFLALILLYIEMVLDRPIPIILF